MCRPRCTMSEDLDYIHVSHVAVYWNYNKWYYHHHFCPCVFIPKAKYKRFCNNPFAIVDISKDIPVHRCFCIFFRTWLWITTQAASVRTALLRLTCFPRRLWRSTAVTTVRHCLVTVCQAPPGWHHILCILPHHICNRLTWVFIHFSFILFSSQLKENTFASDFSIQEINVILFAYVTNLVSDNKVE